MLEYFIFFVALGILLLLFLVFLNVFFSFLVMIHFKGAYHAASSDERVQRILKLATIKKGQKILDLGSGDGKVVLALAQKGAQVEGFEIHPLMVWKSRQLLKKYNVQQKATIHMTNFWNEELSEYDTIVVYGIGYMMKRLEEKIIREAEKGTKIISVYFTFPTLKPKKKIKDVYLYQI